MKRALLSDILAIEREAAAAPLEPPRPDPLPLFDLNDAWTAHRREDHTEAYNEGCWPIPCSTRIMSRADSGTAQPPLDRDIRRVIAAENPAAYPEWYDDRDRWPFIEGTNWTIWLLRRLGAASERPESRAEGDIQAYADWRRKPLDVERHRRIRAEQYLAQLLEAIREFSNDQFQKWPEFNEAAAYFRGLGAASERPETEASHE